VSGGEVFEVEAEADSVVEGSVLRLSAETSDGMRRDAQGESDVPGCQSGMNPQTRNGSTDRDHLGCATREIRADTSSGSSRIRQARSSHETHLFVGVRLQGITRQSYSSLRVAEPVSWQGLLEA
jgi:hypothetical protein